MLNLIVYAILKLIFIESHLYGFRCNEAINWTALDMINMSVCGVKWLVGGKKPVYWMIVVD